MKYSTEFRDAASCRAIAEKIEAAVRDDRAYHIMEFCGGHTHAIFRHGLPDLLPEQIELVHGPGCPVCVLPIGRLDKAIELARNPDVILCSYGDMLRVPGSRKQSLLRAREEGCDVRIVYSALDALGIARREPTKTIIFFAIGFETTTPPTALVIEQAKQLGVDNFCVYCNHVVTPAAIQAILDAPEIREYGAVRVDGFIGPSHVSTVIGSQPYEYFAEEYQKPVVVSGFEPLDVLQSVLMLIEQLNDGRAEVENQFSRGVTREGNTKAKNLVAKVLELRRSFEWRGLGAIPYSGLRIKDGYAAFDAEHRFALPDRDARENKACRCGEVIRGVIKPPDCSIFGTVCTPRNPIGSCMVSDEGACAAYFKFRRREASRAAVTG